MLSLIYAILIFDDNERKISMNGVDLTGKIFGRLLVKEFFYNKERINYWKCICACGREKIIKTQSLVEGRSKSCGCSHRKDLTGKRFGMLVAVELFSNTVKTQHARYWVCKCDCGKVKNINQNRLTAGKTTSCGCNHFYTGKFHSLWKGYGEMSGAFFGIIRNGAKIRNLEFSISQEQIWELFLKQNRKCALTGLDLHFSTLSCGNDGTASLDRIDSSKGYSIDNVWWVHKDINVMKMDLSVEKFKEYCKLVMNKL